MRDAQLEIQMLRDDIMELERRNATLHRNHMAVLSQLYARIPAEASTSDEEP